MKTLTPRDIEHENIYQHYATREDDGRFSKSDPHMRAFTKKIWDMDLGTTVAMSHSGHGLEVRKGYLQVIADNPMMFLKLVTWLSDIRDRLPAKDKPVVEVRSKAIPKVVYAGVGDNTQHLVVMFHTPSFKDRVSANRWWSNLVQSYN